MSKRKAIEAASNETAANPDSAPEQPQSKIELPSIEESPSISPAKIETVGEHIVAATPDEPVAATAAQSEASVLVASAEENRPAVVPEIATMGPRFILRPRHKRHALLAASVAIAAALGAVVGAATTGGLSKPATVDIAVEENRATQQSVARLAEEITSLKASFDAANKSAHNQIAEISERLKRESTDITGSIAPLQSNPLAPQVSVSVPTPRSVLAAESLLPPRLPIVADWSIRDARAGYVYVQGHGDVYQVVPGAPLPGLGPVEQIKRQDGRWLVVTPRGIIVSMRDRRYFEQF
ncbi:MAG TPA: hypothetical protein VI358_15665 [Pseudolabrys sp.]